MQLSLFVTFFIFYVSEYATSTNNDLSEKKDFPIGLWIEISGKPTTKNPKESSNIRWEPRQYARCRSRSRIMSICSVASQKKSGSNTINISLKAMTKFTSEWGGSCLSKIHNLGNKKCFLFTLYDVNFEIWIINMLLSFKLLVFNFYPRSKD